MSSLGDRLAAARTGARRPTTTRDRRDPAELVDDAEPSDDGDDPADRRRLRRRAAGWPIRLPETAARGARSSAAGWRRPSRRPAAQPRPCPSRPQLQRHPATGRRDVGQPSSDRLEDLKGTVHAELLKQLGPKLYDADMDQEELDQQVRAVLADVLASQDRPLSNSDRTQITQEISDDILGYGPIEPFLRDPDVSEVMVNGSDSIWLERSGRLVQADGAVHRRGAPAPHDRQDRVPHRPPRRRVQPDGGRPAPRRQPRQRRHPAAGGRRLRADDPEVLHRPADRPRPDRLRLAEPADRELPRRLRPRPAQHHRLRQHRRREDDDAQRAVVVHPDRRADRHHRGRRRAPAQAGARRPPGVPPGQHRGQGRGHDPRPGQEQPAHAPRPDHRRRGPRRLRARHAAGHEHRPRRLHLHPALQRPARHALPHGDHGADGGHGPADPRDPRAGRLRGRPDRPPDPLQGRLPPDHPHHRGGADGGRRDHPPGHLRLRPLGRLRRRGQGARPAARDRPAAEVPREDGVRQRHRRPAALRHGPASDARAARPRAARPLLVALAGRRSPPPPRTPPTRRSITHVEPNRRRPPDPGVRARGHATVDLDSVTVTIDGADADGRPRSRPTPTTAVERTAVLVIDTSNSMRGDRFEAAQGRRPDLPRHGARRRLRRHRHLRRATSTAALAPTTDRDGAREPSSSDLELSRETRLYDGVLRRRRHGRHRGPAQPAGALRRRRHQRHPARRRHRRGIRERASSSTSSSVDQRERRGRRSRSSWPTRATAR